MNFPVAVGTPTVLLYEFHPEEEVRARGSIVVAVSGKDDRDYGMVLPGPIRFLDDEEDGSEWAVDEARFGAVAQKFYDDTLEDWDAATPAKKTLPWPILQQQCCLARRMLHRVPNPRQYTDPREAALAAPLDMFPHDPVYQPLPWVAWGSATPYHIVCAIMWVPKATITDLWETLTQLAPHPTSPMPRILDQSLPVLSSPLVNMTLVGLPAPAPASQAGHPLPPDGEEPPLTTEEEDAYAAQWAAHLQATRALAPSDPHAEWASAMYVFEHQLMQGRVSTATHVLLPVRDPSGWDSLGEWLGCNAPVAAVVAMFKYRWVPKRAIAAHGVLPALAP